MRDECLHLHAFTSVAEACIRLGAFLHHYNTERPHSQLDYLTPLAFTVAWAEAQTKAHDPYHWHVTSSWVSCQFFLGSDSGSAPRILPQEPMGVNEQSR